MVNIEGVGCDQTPNGADGGTARAPAMDWDIDGTKLMEEGIDRNGNYSNSYHDF